MGVDVCVIKGYGIAIFTEDLSEEVVQKLENNQIPIRDSYNDYGWQFITLGAKTPKKLQRGIERNSFDSAPFNPKQTEIQTSLIPLFLDRDDEYKIDEGERTKALELFAKKYDNEDYHTNIEEEEDGGDDYEDLKKILEENPNSWIPGKYLVIYYG